MSQYAGRAVKNICRIEVLWHERAIVIAGERSNGLRYGYRRGGMAWVALNPRTE